MFQYLLDYCFHKPASPPPTDKTLPIELLMGVYKLMDCPFEQFKLLQKVPELIELIKIDNTKDICIVVLPADGSLPGENMERMHSKLTLPIFLPEGFDVTKYLSLNEPKWRKPELDKDPILAEAYQDLMNDIGGVLDITFELEGFHSTDFTDVTDPVPVYHRTINLEFGAYVFNDSISHDCQLYFKFFSEELEGIPHTLNIWKWKKGDELASLYKADNDKVTVLDCISGVTVEQPPEESLLKDRNMYATLNTPRFLRYHDLVGRQWFRSTSIFTAYRPIDLVPLQVEDSPLISVNVIIPSGFDEVCHQHKELQDIKAI
ncbi:hypothetical protein WICPIJ_002530 [Wickerhamomyces pijperi]|uniref:Uncharacterized protein n=1 Tax=Wickerhamomyces pijperi TaxID=599730 RepID=A0A9P8TPK1_WICPI|nr:hypothetical protein WICPIJ_002530 [Wickerhamomyces pijperi]